MVKKVILDTSFILSAVRSKIDFFEEIPFMGLKIIIPKEVLKEIENVKNSKQKRKDKEIADIALKVLGANKYEEVELGKDYVDSGLRKYCKVNKDVIVATLDRTLKKDISNYLLVIRGRKKLEIV